MVALREIADESIETSELEEELILGLQHHGDTDDPEEEAEELLAIEEALTASVEAELSALAEEADAKTQAEVMFEDVPEKELKGD